MQIKLWQKMNKHTKFNILYSIIFSIIFYLIFIPLTCYCCEPTKTIMITKEDILYAKPNSPYNVYFSLKDLKAIEIMERRHFSRIYPEFSDAERLKNLEYELLGKTWIYLPQEERIKTLKLASSNTMLIGTSLPPSFSSKKMAKRAKTDIPLRRRDNVGLIDGFLRLINPELYENYRKNADKIYYDYEH